MELLSNHEFKNCLADDEIKEQKPLIDYVSFLFLCFSGDVRFILSRVSVNSPLTCGLLGRDDSTFSQTAHLYVLFLFALLHAICFILFKEIKRPADL